MTDPITSGFYLHIFENSADPILILENNRIKDCNPASLKFFECSKDIILGKTLRDLSTGIKKDISPNSSLNDFGLTFRTFSGKKIRRHVSLHNSNKDNVDIQQIIISDKEQVDVPSAIEESEATNLILNIFPGLFFIYDITEGFENAELIRFNSKWYHEKLKYKTSAVPSAYPQFLFSPSEAVRIPGILKELKSGRNTDFEINIRHSEGYDVPYLFVCDILESGSREFFTGIGIDISERKYTELALKQSEEYFKNIFNSSTDGILVMDLDFKLLNANNAIFRMFDYKFEDIAFQNILDFIPKHAREDLSDRYRQLIGNEKIPPIELEIIKRTGEMVPIEINSIIIQYGDRQGILSIIRDLTERKTLEKKIFNSEILSEEKERERFSKELHDGLGPILSTCKIYLHSLNEMLAEDGEHLKISERALTLLDDALASIKEISNNLSPHVLRNFGLVQAVIAFTHNLENISDLKFEVHYNYDQRQNEVIEFTAYRIITELINNSVKYAEASLIVIDINLKKPYLKVSYRDDGKGFEPNPRGKQSRGFGLNNIETRVNKFNGDYSYFTAPGKGVRVEFSLELNPSEK